MSRKSVAQGGPGQKPSANATFRLKDRFPHPAKNGPLRPGTTFRSQGGVTIPLKGDLDCRTTA